MRIMSTQRKTENYVAGHGKYRRRTREVTKMDKIRKVQKRQKLEAAPLIDHLERNS